MSRDQNTVQNYYIKIDNMFLERVDQFIYLETTLTNQNFIHEEVKSGNSCYYSVQFFFFSCSRSKNIKINVYRTIILPFVLYGCETGLLTLREEHKPVVLENRLLRRRFEPEMDKVTRKWQRLHNEELNDLYSDDKMKERCGACSSYG